MKSFLAVFRAGFRYLWSEPLPVILLTLFPIVLILVLGSALSSLMSNDDTLPPAVAAYVSESEDSPLYMFMTGEEIAPYVSLVKCSADEAEAMLVSGECSAVISESAEGVEVRRLEGGDRGSTVVLSLVESYRAVESAVMAAIRDGRDPSAAFEADISVGNAAVGGKVVDAIDYYAITMLVMILLYTGMNGMSLFGKNMTGEFGMRLQASPAPRSTVVAGTLAASTVVSFSQALITLTFSAVAYGVDWGERIPLVLITLFVFTLFSQVISIFVFLIFKNEAATTGFLQAFFWISTFVSKGYVNTDFGEAEKIFKYAPNALAHTVIFGAVYGGDEAVIMQSLLILVGTVAVLGVGAAALGRRRIA